MEYNRVWAEIDLDAIHLVDMKHSYLHIKKQYQEQLYNLLIYYIP